MHTRWETIMTGNLIILQESGTVTQTHTDRFYANLEAMLPPTVTHAWARNTSMATMGVTVDNL